MKKQLVKSLLWFVPASLAILIFAYMLEEVLEYSAGELVADFVYPLAWLALLALAWFRLVPEIRKQLDSE